MLRSVNRHHEVGTNGTLSHMGVAQSDILAPSLSHSPTSRLPMPRPGQVLGLVGTNGIGKSTALKVLAGKLKPNLGRFTVSDC